MLGLSRKEAFDYINSQFQILDLDEECKEISGELESAHRPLIIFGAGVRNSVEQARRLLSRVNAPLVVTWGVRDLFPNGESFGTHGNRAGNFAVQTADYILAIGTRLDTKATGSPASTFAPFAKLVMVDIDQNEIDKMAKIGRSLHRGVCADATDFLCSMNIQRMFWEVEEQRLTKLLSWFKAIEDWKARFPVETGGDGLNPYAVVKELSGLMSADDILVSDTGCSVAWLMQAFEFKGQPFVHAFNNTPMGYGLPAAIGSAFATGKRVVLVTGDGGLGVNVTELATIARHHLNIKIVLMNNAGHQMCRQTQRQWLGGVYPGTSYEGGLATPDFVAVAKAYGIDARSTGCVSMPFLTSLLESDGPGFLELRIPMDADVSPMVKFGKSIEHADPEIHDVAGILREVLFERQRP